MRGAAAAALVLALFIGVSTAEAKGTAQLRVETSSGHVELHRGETVRVEVHLTGTMDCTLPGAPQDATLRLNKASNVAHEGEHADTLWMATPDAWTLPWRQTSVMHYAIDAKLPLSIRSPDGPPRDVTDVISWGTGSQVSSGTACERSFSWTVEGPSLRVHLMPDLPGAPSVRSDPGGGEPASPMAFEGVSSVPTDGKVAAAGGLALVLLAVPMVLVTARRVR